MASFISSLDRPHEAHDAPHSAARLRECLRFLRHVESVEISGTARNWDAQKCFVIHVTVTDSEVDDGDAVDATQAKLTVVLPSAPFQIERTPSELRELQHTIRQWSEKHGGGADPVRCAFCSPIARGDVAAAAKRDAAGGTEHAAPRSRGFLSALFKGDPTRLKSGDEWEAWLNASIARARRVDADEAPLCEGLRHVPPLLARFLLQEFASDVIF